MHKNTNHKLIRQVVLGTHKMLCSRDTNFPLPFSNCVSFFISCIRYTARQTKHNN